MKKIMTAVALSSLVALSAHAAKSAPYIAPAAQPAPAPQAEFNWTGFFLGINAGYGWGQENLDKVYVEDGGFNATIYGKDLVTDASPNFNGWFGGGQVGYNYAFEKVGLLGLEADIQGSGFESDYKAIPGSDFDGFTAESEMNWFGTIRGKLGVFYGDVLFYATGGFAYGGQEVSVYNQYDQVAPETIKTTDNVTRTGWTAGAGIEAVIYGQLTAKAEYLYISFGEETYDLDETATANTPSVWPTQTATADNHINSFRLGLNYHF